MSDIELVIKIPEERYNFLKTHYRIENVLDMAVLNGTPLPKGYGRLMDADGFINSLKGIERLHIDDELRISILDIINNNILVESKAESEE